jgi:hypothetical protein
MGRKRRIKAGNLADLQRVLWRTVVEVEALLDARPVSNELTLRAAHALAQLAGAYRALTESISLEDRITALEHAIQGKEMR